VSEVTMGQQITMPRSVLARLINDAYPDPDDAGPYGPYGPVLRRVVEAMLNPQPLPPKARRLPDGWFGAAAAGATIRYALDRQELAAAAGQVNDSVPASIRRFIEDFCGTPPRKPWPLPYPPPKWWRDVEEIGPVDVLVAAAQFHRVAETMPDNPLAAEFDTGADKLFDASIQQLGR
jgi:hypothetical protein